MSDCSTFCFKAWYHSIYKITSCSVASVDTKARNNLHCSFHNFVIVVHCYNVSGSLDGSSSSCLESLVLGDSVKLFARVNALCNLSRKKSREIAAYFQANF